MIDSVKGFLKINKYPTHSCFIVLGFLYIFNQAYECMGGRGSFSKTKLQVIKSIFFLHEIMNSIVHYSFIDSLVLENSEIGR